MNAQTDDREARRARYDAVKDAFESLELDERAIFLIEAAFTTVASAVDEAGKQVTDLVDRMNESARRHEAETATAGEAPREQPGTASAPNMN